MAFQALINSITPSDNGQGGVQLITVVTFSDSVTSFTAVKTYAFPVTTTQASAVATITADGNVYKTTLASIGTLQAKVGSVIVI